MLKPFRESSYIVAQILRKGFCLTENANLSVTGLIEIGIDWNSIWNF